MSCTANCNQGRACTCGPVITPTRLSLMARLRRWFAKADARQRLAGIEQAIDSVDSELESLQATAFFPTYQAAAWAVEKTEQLKRERILLMRDADDLARAIKTL